MSDINPEKILENFLKTNKEDHYNFEVEENYKVSSGSLQFDVELGGGFGPGLHRFTGMNEGGKTSESLQVMKNFLETVPNSRGFYIKAEGRLSPEMKERSGLNFVTEHSEWENGSCFVFESNIYEAVAEIITKLIDHNETGIKYCFVLDSVDGLILKNDKAKGYEDSVKVAGGAVVAATFMKKMSIKLAKRGHMAIFISQVRADIKLDPYTVKKSPNEKTNQRITYPIRYGRKGGTSIWIEKEIVNLLESFEFIKKSGAWISITDDFKDLLSENKLEFPEKIQGMNKVFKYIEDNPDLCNFLFNYFKKYIQEMS